MTVRIFLKMHHHGCSQDLNSFNTILDVLCKSKRVEKAYSLLNFFRGRFRADSDQRGLCHARKMDEAMEYVIRMKDGECEPNVQTYNLLIRYHCDAAEIEKGLEVFEKMGSGECLPNLETYNVLISSMFVRKKSDDLLVAGNLLIEMVDRGFLPRKFTFNRVLNGLLLTGNQGFAKEILRLQSKCGLLPRQFRL